jgi:hypothetical protein
MSPRLGAALHHPECGWHDNPEHCNCGRTNARSSRREVRNPVLALPSAKALRALPASQRAAMRSLMVELATDARMRANECWRKHKAPMAAYWKAVAVYAGHIARMLK